jgi:lantibiotic modifying enzyme
LDTPAIRQEIAAAIDTTQKFAVWGIDSLCWGNFGRLETLLVAADQLNCPEWRVAAEQAALTILNEATARNGFVLLPNGFPNQSLPGLFHGLAGIGYQLLRLADRRLPSVLLWELSKVD